MSRESWEKEGWGEALEVGEEIVRMMNERIQERGVHPAQMLLGLLQALAGLMDTKPMDGAPEEWVELRRRVGWMVRALMSGPRPRWELHD